MSNIKPFLQWTGGKSHLIPQFHSFYPKDLSGYDTFIEPFAGGGATFLHFLSNGYQFKNVIINDINSVLMNTYRIIRRQPHELLEQLELMKNEYHNLASMEEKQIYFLKLCDAFNRRNLSPLLHAAIFIILNKTGFSAMFRVNAKNEYNIAFGKNRKPVVFCRDNILKIHGLLQYVEIYSKDFAGMRKHISGKTFIYLDPPYYPAGETAGFCQYTANRFNDSEQIRLADFCKSLSCHWMLSNSDCNFVLSLYKNYTVRKIITKHRIQRSREATELLITNY